jgi:hypothetical protein
MNLAEVDTVHDLRQWVEENMKGAEVRVDMHGTIIINTHLVETMGGYLHEQWTEDYTGGNE